MTPAQLGLKVLYTQQDLNHLERKGCAVQMISSSEATKLTLKRKLTDASTQTPCASCSLLFCLQSFITGMLRGVGLHQLFQLALGYHKKRETSVFAPWAGQDLPFCSKIRAWGKSGNWRCCHSWAPLSIRILQT